VVALEHVSHQVNNTVAVSILIVIPANTHTTLSTSPGQFNSAS